MDTCMPVSKPDFPGRGRSSTSACLPHCRVPSSLLHELTSSTSRTPLEVLGAALDLLLWSDSNVQRRVRLSDRFLRERWGRGHPWCARTLELFGRTTGAKKLGSGPAGTLWHTPRPRTAYIVLPTEVVAHLRRPGPTAEPTCRLLQLAGVLLLYATAGRRQLQQGPLHIETSVVDPLGVLLEQGMALLAAQELLQDLVRRGHARLQEGELWLRTHHLALPTPTVRDADLPPADDRGGSGGQMGQRIRSQIRSDLLDETLFLGSNAQSPTTKKTGKAVLAYWIRPPYGVRQQLGCQQVVLASAVSAFVCDEELEQWRRQQPVALAERVSQRLSVWHEGEPWRWPLVGRLLDLLTGLWLPSLQELTLLGTALTRHGDPGRAAVRIRQFFPDFLRLPLGALPPSPTADPAVDGDVAPDGDDAPVPDAIAAMHPPSPDAPALQEDRAHARQRLAHALRLERPVVSPTLPQRQRVRQQLAWHTFERARTELAALLGRTGAENSLRLALAKLDASMEALSPYLSEAPRLPAPASPPNDLPAPTGSTLGASSASVPPDAAASACPTPARVADERAAPALGAKAPGPAFRDARTSSAGPSDRACVRALPSEADHPGAARDFASLAVSRPPDGPLGVFGRLRPPYASTRLLPGPRGSGRGHLPCAAPGGVSGRFRPFSGSADPSPLARPRARPPDGARAPQNPPRREVPLDPQATHPPPISTGGGP
jgi:hypothetical protein